MNVKYGLLTEDNTHRFVGNEEIVPESDTEHVEHFMLHMFNSVLKHRVKLRWDFKTTFTDVVVRCEMDKGGDPLFFVEAHKRNMYTHDLLTAVQFVRLAFKPYVSHGVLYFKDYRVEGLSFPLTDELALVSQLEDIMRWCNLGPIQWRFSLGDFDCVVEVVNEKYDISVRTTTDKDVVLWLRSKDARMISRAILSAVNV